MKTTVNATLNVGTLILAGLLAVVSSSALIAEERVVKYQRTSGPFLWLSELPDDIPFEQSEELVGILSTGVHSDYRVADTWYPSWASDDNLYSPWTDGQTDGMRSGSGGRNATTGQAVMIGDDPLNLKIKALGKTKGDPHPYQGRYPCGSLVYNGVWYYGTYCLGPAGSVTHDGMRWNWPALGPMPGFRILRGVETVCEQTRSCAVSGLDREILSFEQKVPKQTGQYQFVAELLTVTGNVVRSLRDFKVTTSAK